MKEIVDAAIGQLEVQAPAEGSEDITVDKRDCPTADRAASEDQAPVKPRRKHRRGRRSHERQGREGRVKT